MNENFDNYNPVIDGKGKVINPGTWSESRLSTEEEVLAELKLKAEYPEEELKTKPNSSESLIQIYDFFRENIHNPKRVFYPCCYLDVSPIKGFPESEVILMDKEKGLEEKMRQEGITQFIQGDVLKYTPETPFDLVIALNPCLTSKDLTRHLSNRGYVLANNWHNNASQLLEDSDFEGIGTIDKNKNKVYLARKDLSKLEPGYYVFRKLK